MVNCAADYVVLAVVDICLIGTKEEHALGAWNVPACGSGKLILVVELASREQDEWLSCK